MAPGRGGAGPGLLLAGGIATGLAAVLSILWGTARLPLADVWEAMVRFDEQNMNHQIVVDLRIPRTVGVVMVGAALSAAGAVMQGMTRNPLADCGILGINAGGAFALAVCQAVAPDVGYQAVALCSFGGAALSTGAVYGLTGLRHGKQSPMRLTLAGTAVGALLSALSQGVALRFQVGREVTFWTAGGVSGIRLHQLAQVAPFLAAALLGALALSRSLSVLAVGEEGARGLGLHVGRTKAACMLVVLVLAGASVALAGPIAFVGLMVPHMVRGITGADYRRIVPGSMVLGSLFLTCADLLSRLLNPPHETPLGLLCAVIGVTFFLILSRREGRSVHA